MLNNSNSMNGIGSSLIAEGFICPECQQDMTSIELLQAHFELMHVKSKTINKRNNYSSQSSSSSLNVGQITPNGESTFSFLAAKAKTLISNYNEASETDTEANSIQISNTSTFNEPSSSSYNNNFMKQYFNSNQVSGHFTVHTSDFKKFRDNTIGRYVIQSNKLLITLDKLISFDYAFLNDDFKRDGHYKSIVSWVDDKDVRLCPNCAKSFNMLNRKHHCRLCGAIMCNKCSQFISFTLAKQLTDPDSFVKAQTSKYAKNNQNETSNAPTEFKLKRSDSITSVNSYFSYKSTPSSSPNKNSSKLLANLTTNQKEVNLDLMYLRLCCDCGKQLGKKYKSFKDKMVQPEFQNLYDELNSCIIESKRIYPIYTKMADSLNIGETVHQLSNADQMRHKLIKLFQQIESISGSILKYEPTTDSHDQLKLQRNIRFFAINYLKEHSFTLSSLPNPEEYSKLKAQRQVYLVEEMRRAELEQLKQQKQINERAAKLQIRASEPNVDSSSLNEKNKKRLNPKITVDNSNGWIPSFNKDFLLDENDFEDSNEDETFENSDNTSLKSKKSNTGASEEERALRIQIQLVEGYLKDARKHNKKDEINALEQNLNELLNSLVNK